jgi:sporulation protein YlmC with PRC-barrel domain
MRIVKSVLAASLFLTLAAVAQTERSSDQERTRKESGQERAHEGMRGRAGMNAQQVADMFRDTKHSLSDSIKTAEKACNGKAAFARCLSMTQAQIDAERAGTKSNETRTTEEGKENYKTVCQVTCLVDNDRLVEVFVDAGANDVIAQHEVSMIHGMGLAGRETGISYAHEGQRETRDFDMAARWQKMTDILGKSVKNPQNEDLGKIEDVAIDPSSGRSIYAVLSFGGFLGMGDKYFAIPWSALDLTGDSKNFVLAVSKDRLKGAEGFDKSAWPNMADQRWATEIHRYYNRAPYWEPASDTGEEQVSVEARDQWYSPTRTWQKASDLVGKGVRSNASEDLGKLHDIAVDPDSGRLMYGILSANGKYYAIPWGALSMTPDGKYLVLNIDKSQFQNAYAFNKDTWPNLTDRRWATDEYRFYHVKPYWSETAK